MTTNHNNTITIRSAPTCDRIRHHRSITGAIALTLALTAGAAPVASADPPPLAKTEAAIANHHSGTQANVGPCSEVCSAGAGSYQSVSAVADPTYTSPCSEVCSGGAASYGSVSQPSWTPNDPRAGLPHDPRPRSVALSSDHGAGKSNLTARTPASTASCGDVCSGHGYGPVSAPATAVRAVTPAARFDWGDAGIGAGAALVLTGLGLASVRVAPHSRARRTLRQPTANS